MGLAAKSPRKIMMAFCSAIQKYSVHSSTPSSISWSNILVYQQTFFYTFSTSGKHTPSVYVWKAWKICKVTPLTLEGNGMGEVIGKDKYKSKYCL